MCKYIQDKQEEKQKKRREERKASMGNNSANKLEHQLIMRIVYVLGSVGYVCECWYS